MRSRALPARARRAVRSRDARARARRHPPPGRTSMSEAGRAWRTAAVHRPSSPREAAARRAARRAPADPDRRRSALAALLLRGLLVRGPGDGRLVALAREGREALARAAWTSRCAAVAFGPDDAGKIDARRRAVASSAGRPVASESPRRATPCGLTAHASEVCAGSAGKRDTAHQPPERDGRDARRRRRARAPSLKSAPIRMRCGGSSGPDSSARARARGRVGARRRRPRCVAPSSTAAASRPRLPRADRSASVAALVRASARGRLVARARRCVVKHARARPRRPAARAARAALERARGRDDRRRRRGPGGARRRAPCPRRARRRRRRSGRGPPRAPGRSTTSHSSALSAHDASRRAVEVGAISSTRARPSGAVRSCADAQPSRSPAFDGVRRAEHVELSDARAARAGRPPAASAIRTLPNLLCEGGVIRPVRNACAGLERARRGTRATPTAASTRKKGPRRGPIARQTARAQGRERLQQRSTLPTAPARVARRLGCALLGRSVRPEMGAAETPPRAAGRAAQVDRGKARRPTPRGSSHLHPPRRTARDGGPV